MEKITNVIKYCMQKSNMVTSELSRMRYLPSDVTHAAQIGIRRSKIDNSSIFMTAAVTGASVTKRGIKPHLPGVCAVIGFPAPFGSIAGFGIGKLLQKVI